jgi:ribose transport system substrate-binding protein
MKHAARIAIATFVLALAAGCGGSGAPKQAATGGTGAPAGGKRIGVTLLTEQHGFYQALRGGLEESARAKGYQLFVTSGEFDATKQANQIDEFIAQKVDAIVVCPCDSRAVGASIAQANQAGIPVFTADIANASGMGHVVSHIASDNTEGGRRAGELMAKAIGGKGTVAIITHPEVTSVQDRVAGFKETIAKYPGIHLVAELSAEGKRDRAVKVMEDILQSHPDLDGVFGINDDSALGALAAIEAAGKSSRIRIVGYDANPEAQEKIKAGAIYGDVMQDPARIGQLTIEAIAKHFAGEPVDSLVPVPVGEFTAAKAP